MAYSEPTSHVVDVSKGLLGDATGAYQKRLRDLTGIYADESAFETAMGSSADDIVYNVTDCRPKDGHGDLIFGVTHMMPGRIGDEYYLTRGHIHALANRPETYYGESGIGVMLLESPHGDVRAIEIRPRVICYVPPFWIHRSVNVGAEPLVMSFCYPADSGQDYSVIERSGGMKQRIVSDGTGWKAVPNQNYRERSAADISALLESADVGK